MKKTILMGTAVLVAASLEAADVRSDAVISFRANAMRDLNGDGKLNSSSELLDCIDPANTGHSKYGRWPTGATNTMLFRKEDVMYHSFPGTNNEQVIWFSQPMTEKSRDDVAGTVTYEYSPNEIWISSLGSEFGTSYTVYGKVRLDPRNSLNNNKMWLFNLGYSGSKSGLMVGFSGSGQNRALEILGGAFYKGENIAARTDQWLDVAVSVEGPPEGETGTVTLRVVAYQDGVVSLSKTYTQEITDAKKTTKPGSQLLIGAEGNNDGNKTFQTTYKTDGSFVSCTGGGQCYCFIGSLSELTLWNRALSIEEMQSLVRMHDGKLWQVGVKNGKSAEFTATTSNPDAVSPRGIWSTTKPSLAPGERMDIAFPVRDTMAGQSVLFSYATAEASGAGTIRATLNGTSLGEKTVDSGAHTLSFFVPKDVLLAGEGNLLRVERIDAGDGLLQLDSCWMGGAWHLGYADGAFNEFCHEGQNWPDYYIDDYRFNRLRRVMLDSGNNNVDNIRFMVPEETLSGDYHWNLTLKLNGGSTDNTDFTMRLNGQLLDARTGKTALNGTTRTFRIPASMLTCGENVLELKNNASVAGGYVSLDYVWFALRQDNGMVILFR